MENNIVARCLAIIIKGHNTGKTVEVERWCVEGMSYRKPGEDVDRVCTDQQHNRWLVHSPRADLVLMVDGELVIRDRACFTPDFLMRINGYQVEQNDHHEATK